MRTQILNHEFLQIPKELLQNKNTINFKIKREKIKNFQNFFSSGYAALFINLVLREYFYLIQVCCCIIIQYLDCFGIFVQLKNIPITNYCDCARAD